MRYFCPSAIFDYLEGQMEDKMGDNLQISKLKCKFKIEVQFSGRGKDKI